MAADDVGLGVSGIGELQLNEQKTGQLDSRKIPVDSAECVRLLSKRQLETVFQKSQPPEP